MTLQSYQPDHYPTNSIKWTEHTWWRGGGLAYQILPHLIPITREKHLATENTWEYLLTLPYNRLYQEHLLALPYNQHPLALPCNHLRAPPYSPIQPTESTYWLSHLQATESIHWLSRREHPLAFPCHQLRVHTGSPIQPTESTYTGSSNGEPTSWPSLGDTTARHPK